MFSYNLFLIDLYYIFLIHYIKYNKFYFIYFILFLRLRTVYFHPSIVTSSKMVISFLKKNLNIHVGKSTTNKAILVENSLLLERNTIQEKAS